MPDRQRGVGRLGLVAGAVGCLGLAAGLAWWAGAFGGAGRPGQPARRAAAELTPESPLPALAEGLAQGDGMALAVLSQRATPKVDAPEAAIPEGASEGEASLDDVPPRAPRVEAIPDGEAAGWRAVIDGLRAGFPKFSAYGRASAIVALGQIYDRYAVEPAPADWAGSLESMHQVLASGLGDTDPAVRVAALRQAAAFWSWAPGRDLESGEVDAVAAIKKALHRDVVRRLDDPTPIVRASAVQCLAILPLDAEAAPAVARLADTDRDVRLSVLRGFADRREILNEETILPLLYDNMPGVAPVAEEVLKRRGVGPDLMGLCKFMVNPRPEMRISSIPMILERTDIDPTVWLVFLSRDRDEAVRSKAVEALAARNSPEAKERLAEMAQSDPSAEVRQAASKAAPDATTASLPPLPGSPSLNPRAN
jgi:hypothetical protein